MRVVVIGIANQQTSLPVDRFPVEYVAQRYLTGAIRHTVGGVAFNVARSLCALGHVVALASPLGEDYPAAMIDAEAYRYNLSTHLCRRELARTPRSVVLYDTTGRRQVNTDLTDGLRMEFDTREIIHLRPSGNEPEFRCYVEADTEGRADELKQQVLSLMETWKA